MPLSHDDGAVLKHLEFLQNIIDRMARNSLECKKWGLSLVVAIFALTFQQKNGDATLLALIPLITFMLLDSYYLELERSFVKKFNESANSIRSGGMEVDQLFNFKPRLSRWRQFWMSFQNVVSPSVFPFYAILYASGLVASRLV